MIVDIRTMVLGLRGSDNVVMGQPDYYGAGPTEPGEKAAGNSYPVVMPFGFMARPLDPSGPDAADLTACEAIVFEGSDEGRIMPTTDPRYPAVIPDTGSGGSVHYAVTDDGSHQDATTVLLAGSGLQGVTAGSLFIRVPYAEGAKAHLIQVDLGTNKIRLVHGDGPALELSQTGVSLSGSPATNLVGTGGAPLMTDDGRVAAAWGQIATCLANLGQAFTPPVGYTSTTVKA